MFYGNRMVSKHIDTRIAEGDVAVMPLIGRKSAMDNPQMQGRIRFVKSIWVKK
jgi:hypothetical protein